jgi:hypothetical protein
LDAKRLVKATLALVGGLHVTSEVTGVDLRYAALTADNAAPQLFRHRPASLSIRLAGSAGAYQP